MTLRTRIGSAWVDTLPKVHVAGADITPVTVREFHNGAWRTVWSQIAMEVQPPFVSRGGTGFQQTNIVEANVTGAQGAVDYAWSRVSGDTRINITQNNTQSTRFVATVQQGETLSAVWRCTVTDTVTGATATDTVEVTFESLSGF